MQSTITSRGQTVIPAAIRRRFKRGPADRLEWIVHNDQIQVVPCARIRFWRFGGAVRAARRRVCLRIGAKTRIRHEAPELLEKAAAIKACYPLSLADAWIAACAALQGASLVHKDPEFQSLDLEQMLLPLKAPPKLV